MKTLFKSDSFAIGLAMFSMFFGAGNIIYPLAIGQYAGDKNFFAMIGLLITAAIMPIAGVIAMILFDGNERRFFGRLGRIPGFLLAILIISLLGPLGSTPRCIALSYTTLKSAFLNISPVLFSAISCGIIFLFSFKKNSLLTLLGWILTPVLIGSLILIILLGIFTGPSAPIIDQSNFHMFLHGLSEGYNTMDLLAAFFFSATIVNVLKKNLKEKKGFQQQNLLGITLKGSLIGMMLLAAIYVGFSYIASFHANELIGKGKDELLAAMTLKIAGGYGGILVCITISLACLTTAIALVSAFADFFQREVFKGKVSYPIILAATLLITFFISTFEFSGISAFLWPILQVCYPGLIILTIVNIIYGLKNHLVIIEQSVND